MAYETFNFGPDYQDALLASLIHHPEHFNRYYAILRASFFSGSQRVATALALFDFWREHGPVVKLDIINQVVFDSIQRTSQEKDEESIRAYIKRLKERDCSDYRAIAARVIQWCKRRGIWAVLEKASLKFNEGKEDENQILADFESAFSVGTDTHTQSAIDLALAQIDPDSTLLGDRFLCRQGGMLLVASTGAGKSVVANQLAVAFACGRETLGIKPSRPLKVLVIQAEDDPGDCAEMLVGAIEGLKLTDDEILAVRMNTVYEPPYFVTGEEFLGRLNERIFILKPDLIIINPLNSYLGSDASNAEAVTGFLRNGLNPIMARHNCAVLLVHHTVKTVSRERQQAHTWRPSDWIYSYAGSNEIGNWCRSCLSMEATHHASIFKFVAAKRGKRLGWKNDFGEPELIRHFAHSGDKLFWRAATPEEIQAAEQARDDSKKRKRGRPAVIGDGELLECLEDAQKLKKGLTQGQWLNALHEREFIINQSGLSKRIKSLKDDGLVRQDDKGIWWLVKQ